MNLLCLSTGEVVESFISKGTFYPPQETDENIRYINSTHGRYQLYYKGYLYNRNLSSGMKTYWRCTQNGRSKCSARIVGTIDGLTVTKPHHNHGPCELPEEKIRRGRDLDEYYQELGTETQE